MWLTLCRPREAAEAQWAEFDLDAALWRIASDDIRAAACIVGWHLNEARRLLADLDTPPSGHPR